MRELRRERLDIRDPRNENIALADRQAFAEGPVLRGPIDTLVVDPQLFARLHVVEHHHFLGAYHGELPFFMGIEPRELDVREHPARELHRQKHDILDCGLQIALAVRSDPYGLLPKQVECH